MQLHSVLLFHLLSFIHRDTGQYTVLAGYGTSVDEAIKVLGEERQELRQLKAEKRKRERSTP